MKGDFQKTLLLFHIGRKSFVENKWLWLHTACKSLLGLSFMIDNQTYNVRLFTAMYPINNHYR